MGRNTGDRPLARKVCLGKALVEIGATLIRHHQFDEIGKKAVMIHYGRDGVRAVKSEAAT
jgi:hypothetical protein